MIKNISDDTMIKKEVVALVLDSFTDNLCFALSQGYGFRINNFGRFTFRKTKSRICPSTKELILPRKRLVFEPLNEMKFFKITKKDDTFYL